MSAPSPGVQLIQVAGEVDLLTKPRLVKCVEQVLRSRPRHLILDMSAVSFIGASGLEVIVRTRDNSVRYGTDLHISGATHPAVARLFTIARLDRVLTLHPTWRDALTTLATTAAFRTAG